MTTKRKMKNEISKLKIKTMINVEHVVSCFIAIARICLNISNFMFFFGNIQLQVLSKMKHNLL